MCIVDVKLFIKDLLALFILDFALYINIDTRNGERVGHSLCVRSKLDEPRT